MEENKFVLAFEKELNLTEKGMAILSEKKSNLVIDVTTDGGFKEARKERGEQNKILLGIDRLAIDGKKAIDEARSSLKGRVTTIFEPIVASFTKEDIKRKAEVARLARIEEERIQDIHEKINSMRNLAVNLNEKSADEIQDIIEAVDNIDVSETFSEFTQEALSAQKDTLSLLNDAMTSAIKQKALADQQALVAKQLEESEAKEKIAALKEKAQERLNKLMMIPTTMFGKTALELKSKIDSISDVVITAEEFCEFTEQAIQSKETVISQLQTMLNQAEQMEAIKSQQPEEQKEKESVAMPSPTAGQEQAFNDAANTGTGYMQGGKRIAPEDVKLSPDEIEQKPSTSQFQKNTNAIEAQSTHKPPHASIMNWSREFNVSGECFSKLEELLATHYTKNV